MKGTHRILAIIVIALIAVGVVNYLPRNGENGGGSVKPAEKPVLWNLTDPPVLQTVSWERNGNIEVTTLSRDVEEKLDYQLRALGYYPVYANWSNCRWTIWNGRKAYYVGETEEGVLVARGDLKAVVEWVNETSKCGKPGWKTTVIGPSPQKALSYTVSLIGDALEKDGVIVVPSEWDEKIPWNLANYSVEAGKVKILILIYATDEQLEYARSLFEGKTLCLSTLGYRALVVLEGPTWDVSKAYDSIESVANTRGASCR
ncbi:hypothetical protein [Thermococcus sp. 21S9]|uniref:hypothetical protein n=1 Tax=Thermococcus sp. 21S9 TaxID=1638223 RepID=UPI001438F9C7|nr:hypothetical protein [Thermococcus sp. 21S9]NJE54895.1 hypothetical protein [Thermococcus sp. 21S9]